MRYLIAIVFAVVMAAGATLYLASPVASWVVAQMTFDNPDSVADLHSAIFMAVNAAGLVVGWGLGYVLGGLLTPPQRPI